MRRALALLVLAGCGASSPGPAAVGPPARVVSLAPSITETEPLVLFATYARLVRLCTATEVGSVPTPTVARTWR